MGDGKNRKSKIENRNSESGKTLILEKSQAVFTAEAQRTLRNGRGGARPYRSWGEALSTLSGSDPNIPRGFMLGSDPYEWGREEVQEAVCAGE